MPKYAQPLSLWHTFANEGMKAGIGDKGGDIYDGTNPAISEQWDYCSPTQGCEVHPPVQS